MIIIRCDGRLATASDVSAERIGIVDESADTQQASDSGLLKPGVVGIILSILALHELKHHVDRSPGIRPDFF